MKKRYFAPETEIVAACPGSLLYQISDVESGGDGEDFPPDEANTGLFDEVEAPRQPLELIPDYQIKAKHLDIQIEFYS